MGKYFGTDGFRGEANVDLTVEHAYKVGRFLGWYYGKQAKGDRCRVVIGKDTRRSSYMFEYSLAAGLTASGADTYLLHVTTTPSVSHVIRTEEFSCGILISASHYPFYDNGIKVMNGNGEKLEDSVITEIEKYLDGELEEIPLAKRENIGRTQDFAAGRNRYIGYLISIATRSFKGKKVGLDCSNGSASSVAKSVFDALGADTYVINDKPDGLNINRDCGSTHIENLQKFVKEKGLDVGFAYDGDADRCLAVDENGNVYWNSLRSVPSQRKAQARSSALWDRPEQVRPPSRDRLPAPSERSMSGSALAAFTTRRRFADTERHTWEQCRAVSPMQCVRQA